MRYDRSEIMRRAHALRRENNRLSLSEALTKAWGEARTLASATLPIPLAASPKGQTPGLRGAARRYGLDRLADRARRAVAELVIAATLATVAQVRKPALLAVEDYHRGSDGTWRMRDRRH